MYKGQVFSSTQYELSYGRGGGAIASEVVEEDQWDVQALQAFFGLPDEDG